MMQIPTISEPASRQGILSRGPIRVDVARSFDDIATAMTLRARVFQEEQACPYDEEFDGNDLAGAVHLIARRNAEPVGAMRIRWFASFAKSERFAVVRNERTQVVALALIDAACEFAGRKGYKILLGHAEKRVAPFLVRRAGGRVRKGRPSFFFSDQEFVEIIREIDPPSDCLTLDTPPLILARPEGEWDQPGVLDRSSCRGARVRTSHR